MIKKLTNCKHLVKDSINNSEEDTFKSTLSEEESTKNVEKECEEEIETNKIQLKCNLCEYKSKNRNTLTKHLD